MVIATAIQTNGSLHEVSVPAKCADVLEWLRGKLKQPNLQYQGSIKDKERRVIVFAESGSDADDNVNQHILGGNFQEEVFVGQIAVMLTSSTNEDNYEKPSSAYQSLKPSEYEALYAGWTFDNEDDDDDENEEDEEENDEEEEVEEQPEDDEVEEEVEDEPEPLEPKKTSTRIKAAVVSQDVRTMTPLRELVRMRFQEVGLSMPAVVELETALLERTIRECTTQGVEITWSSSVFMNHYRGRCLHMYENLRGPHGYVRNPTDWKQRLQSGALTPTQFAEMNPLELHAGRWKAQVEKQIEKDRHLYSNKGGASIYLYCSVCKKKSKCDYYQMQTRSADEPMTTFVTCLECDKRWKF